MSVATSALLLVIQYSAPEPNSILFFLPVIGCLLLTFKRKCFYDLLYIEEGIPVDEFVLSLPLRQQWNLVIDFFRKNNASYLSLFPASWGASSHIHQTVSHFSFLWFILQCQFYPSHIFISGLSEIRT